MRYKDYVVFYGEIGTADSVKAKEFETEEQSEEVDIKLDWYEGDEEGLKKMFPMLWEMYGERPIEW
ncbi:hypothetical protein EXW32_15345 [Bacillus mycoides]|uniref:Uncharacterized protein n=1 Tax=Bacillus mycoides TaxID=1405 RepID=A0ABX6ZFC4_BACMY|nr:MULTISPECIES: hypothetical protein [Bacillus]KXY47312.1 endonuclease [Bacillus cereus]AJH18619.1 hypothetical protein BG05_2987 [Bacillus mycoides]EEL98780.1 hypothetical protein bmyco0001_27410 [Bacillus mycoides DSM 2048]KUH41526.1 hypothetical protein M2E15_1617 [Bacillus mycoides]KZE07694.1 hypothetical protein B4117_0847 [Bacillus mycoides]